MKNKFMKNRNGFTLIGLIIFMVVVGIALPPLLMVAYNAVENSVAEEILLNSTNLANEVMDEIKIMVFSNIVSQSNQAFTGNFSNYSYDLTVYYVSSPNYDTDAGTTTKYKHVNIVVHNNIISAITSELTTIITDPS